MPSPLPCRLATLQTTRLGNVTGSASMASPSRPCNTLQKSRLGATAAFTGFMFHTLSSSPSSPPHNSSASYYRNKPLRVYSLSRSREPILASARFVLTLLWQTATQTVIISPYSQHVLLPPFFLCHSLVPLFCPPNDSSAAAIGAHRASNSPNPQTLPPRVVLPPLQPPRACPPSLGTANTHGS